MTSILSLCLKLGFNTLKVTAVAICRLGRTRLDRPHDPHGGVSIDVKSYLYCKPGPRLHVHNLEAVWVETRLEKEGLCLAHSIDHRTPMYNTGT